MVCLLNESDLTSAQTVWTRNWTMKTRSTRLNVESLDGRILPSTVAYGDFNRDGRQDVAAITAPTRITVSLANPNGGYTVSAILTTPQNRPLQNISVIDRNVDGDLDIVAFSNVGHQSYLHTWLGFGDGTFGNRKTERWNPEPGW
jgi:hypothetical protein